MSFTRNETSVPMQIVGTDLHWREVFDKYDSDKDGKIFLVELKAIIESGEYDEDLPADVGEEIIDLADRDNSGYLNVWEFIEMMHNHDLKVVSVNLDSDSGSSFQLVSGFQKFMSRYVNSIVPQRNPVDTTGSSTGRNNKTTYSDSLREKRKKTCCWPPVVCMVLISLVEVVIFCYDAAHGKTPTERPIAKFLIYNPQKRQEAWRFLTYMLVHVDAFHLFTNILVQLFLGVPLEVVNQWWRVLIVYCAGGAGAALATALADPAGLLAGASAGVYALSTAHIATVIMNWSSLKTAIFQVLGFVLLVAKDVALAVYLKQPDQNIVHAAHYTGAAAGLLVGIGVLRNLESLKWEKLLWWAAVVLYCALMLAAILTNIFWKRNASLT